MLFLPFPEACTTPVKSEIKTSGERCENTSHIHTHTNLFLSQSSRGGGGIHLFRSRSDRLSLGRKSTHACSLKFWGTDSIGCRESGYNPRGSQSLLDAMQWDNQQSINQSINKHTGLQWNNQQRLRGPRRTRITEMRGTIWSELGACSNLWYMAGFYRFLYKQRFSNIK